MATPPTLRDDGIDVIVRFIESAEELGAALDMPASQAARIVLKGAKIMTDRNAVDPPSALSRMGCAKTKH